MVTQPSTGAERSGSDAKAEVVRSVVGLALALAVVAGIGARHLAQQRGGAASGSVAHNGGAPTTSVEQEGRGAGRGDQRDRPVTVYLVSADEQAARLQDAIADGNRILESLDLPAFSADVVVVRSAEHEAAVMRAYADADAIRGRLGLPGVTVIDLRGG
jgi:hypothetical protein